MSDTAKILTIDQSQIDNGYVNVDCTVTVNGTAYDQIFTVPATDPVSVVSSVTTQAESFRAQALATAAIVTSPTDLSTLVNKTINL